MFVYLLFIGSLLGFTVSVLGLHYVSPRIGFTPLLFFIAGMTAVLSFSSPATIFLEPFSEIILSIPADVLVPSILLVILVLYIANGTQAAQQAIYGVAGINLFALLSLVLLMAFARSASVTGESSILSSYQPDYREFIASSLVFVFDMFIIAITYQGIRNAFPQVPFWVTTGLALLIALWTDSVLFYMLGSLGTERFMELLPGDIANKSLAGVVIWLPATLYLQRIANELPEFADHNPRHTFDVLKSTVNNLSEALRRSQAELRESKINFQQLATHIDDIFWLSDPKRRRIYYVSPAFEKITGIKREDFYADDTVFVNIVHPEDREDMRRHFYQEHDYQEEFRILKDGQVRWLRNKAFAVYDERGEVCRFAGIAQDITLQKNAQDHKLNLAIERERVRVLKEFISDASHDLKTPLTSIKLKAYLLTTAKDEDVRRRHIEELNKQTDQLTTLIDDLFTLSRLENVDELRLNTAPVNQIVSEVCRSLQSLAEEKNITLKVDLERQQMPEIMADAHELARALSNLVGNGIRYTYPDGEVTVQTRFQFNRIIIKISDTGIGIHPDEVEHVFERFYRTKTATSHNIEGSGLGLAIVKRIVTRHHGQINVESTLGKGTTFTLTFPPAEQFVQV